MNFEEFNKGLSDYGAKLSADEAKEIFTSFYKDGTGHIDFDELLIAVRVYINLNKLNTGEEKQMMIFFDATAANDPEKNRPGRIGFQKNGQIR